MHIAIVASHLPEKGKKTGGVSLAVHRLATELSKIDGISVTVFGLVCQQEESIYSYTELLPRLGQFRKNKTFILFFLPIILNFINFHKFNVVHLHGDDWFYFIRRQPSVRTLHGSALYEAKSALKLKRKILQYSIYPLEQLSTFLASFTIAVGRDSQDLYRTNKLIGNGVDTRLFKPKLKTNNPSIMFIGTWHGRKRGEFLHKIFLEQVLPQIPEAKLYVVSDVWENHPNVIPIKFPTDKELADILATTWIFSYPSLYEGFGIPYIEALASGTAIISSPNVGANFVLSGGQYGIIEEDESFGDAIIELLKNHERRDQMAQKGLARAAEFSWEQICKQHLEAYQEAIQKFGA